MKRSNRLVILVGVLLAILAFVGIVVLLNQTAAPDSVPPEDRTAKVLVATEDIEIGQAVTPDKVEVRDVPLDAVQGTPFRDESQVGGRPALVFVPSGTQVNAETFGVIGSICVSCQLQPGEKAIAFQVDRVTGLDFLVQPGDHIDVVLAQNITVLQETADSAANTDEDAPRRFETVQGLENQRSVKAILQNKRVLYVSATRVQPVTQEPAEGEGETPPTPAQIDSVIIVFAGTEQDAELIKFAQSNLGEVGFLTAILRHINDEAIEETTGITIDVLVEEYGLRLPGIIEQLVETPAP